MAGGSTTQDPLTNGSQVARPLHVQRLEHSLQLNSFLNSARKQLSYTVKTSDDDSSDQSDSNSSSSVCFQDTGGTYSTRQERRHDRMTRYNLFKVKKNRKWIKTLLLSDSSDSSEDELSITSSDIDQMLKIHKLKQISAVEFSSNSKLHQYQYLSAGLLSTYDKFYEHQKLVLGSKKKFKDRAYRPKAKAKKIKMETSDELSLSQQEEAVIAEALKLEDSSNQGCEDLLPLEVLCTSSSSKGRKRGQSAANQQAQPAAMAARRRRLWIALAKKEINRAQKQMITAHKEVLSNARRLSLACQRECRRSALLSQKVMKDTPSRSRRLTKEMLLYWKRYEKVEREHRRKAEKEAQEQLRMDIERREAKRQQRKLNFLITQTELYAHFMSRKIDALAESGQDQILNQLDEIKEENPLVDDDYDCEIAKSRALKNAKDAYDSHMEKHQLFSADVTGSQKTKKNQELSQDFNENFRLTNPSLSTDEDLPQPNIFLGILKVYQLKGMNWLNNLYDKGINGILADEMGLGKTVQTIAFLATLAEGQGIWGPFLIIAPASTLHNWQQELCKFVPKFKVLPYWGNTADRKILRKFWSQKGDLHVEASPFHVLVTSYQLVVQDVKYFQRIKWQYMVLDEAQAIKSTSSVRWKILLGFSCRNRLLLTGTPIQNSMAELWALLHFIMPTLFDSHEEFNEWFSKDIESHAENKSTIDEKHLSRLHMILKPFMLRRIKKDVENELSDKIEILVKCSLTQRQRALYRNLRSKISIEDLMQTSLATSNSATSSLMNLVMQFRKVCNHPDLFERREARSPYRFSLQPLTLPRLLFRDCILYKGKGTRERVLYKNFAIFAPDRIHRNIFPEDEKANVHQVSWESTFSFLRLMGLSPGEMSRAVLSGLVARWLICYLVQQEAYRIQQEQQNTLTVDQTNRRPHLLLPLRVPPEFMVLTADCSTFYAQTDHWHHQLIRDPLTRTSEPLIRNLQDLAATSQKVVHSRSSGLHQNQPTLLPRFLLSYCPKVLSTYPEYYTADPSHRWLAHRQPCPRQRKLLFSGPKPVEKCLSFFHHPVGGLEAARPNNSWSHIIIPDRETLVTDSGKLRVLDVLLSRLKAEGHRVLIYSQMTRMIDLLEEYMWHRKHTYIRLDGSSKISDRRNMVADFQERKDIFVFLLSTRAGGLGINLTAADTVIFYDSDWNPTVDQQAMDRAHRLGQTKQVTVYRLICNGTIEERILDRACQKSEIQRMVISGGNFKPDTLKPKEVVSLFLEDEELERKFHQRQEEKKLIEGYGIKEKKRKKERLGKPPGKRKRLVEEPQPLQSSLTAPDHQTDLSVLSMESVPPSPNNSEQSQSSTFVAPEESSNDESSLVVVVDDSNPPLSTTETASPVPSFFSLTGTGWSTIDGTLEVSPPGTPMSLSLLGSGAGSGTKRGSGRARGRPRGSGRGSRGSAPGGGSSSATRGARSNTLATTAAELAAAQAGKSAAFAAYNYALQNLGTSSVSSSGRAGAKGVQARASRGLHHHHHQHHLLSHKLLSHHQSTSANSDK